MTTPEQSTGTGQSSGPEVSAEVDQINRIIAVLEAEDRRTSATWLRDQLSAQRPDKPVVVVAGEDKRGKSTLVNALLGMPDMSPVGVKVVTGSPITFFHSTTGEAQILRYGVDEAMSVSVDDARRLATVEGNPGNEENIRAVRIGLDQPLLAGLNLVDTPGVGGLASGHAALTLQSLTHADALLFVVDAAAPLRAKELEFLRRATSRIQTVILVLTKTDIHPGWRTTLADDAEILGQRAPRFAGCPTAAVSSVLALRGVASGDDEFAAEIREESGIADLEIILRGQVVASVENLRNQNLLRAAITEMVAWERDLMDQLAAIGPDGVSLEALKAERARLEQLRQEKGEWPGKLDAEIRKVTLTRSDTCARRILDIRHAYDERVKDAKMADFDSMPGEVLADLTALAGELNEIAAQRLAAVVSELLDGMDSAAQSSINAATNVSLEGQLMELTASNHHMQHADRMSLLSELGRGRSLLSLMSGSSAIAFLAPPFGIAIGLGLGSVFAFQAWRDRSQHTRAADFKAWLMEQVSRAQLAINNNFALQVVDLQAEMKALIRKSLADREAHLTESVEKATAAQKMAVAQRKETIAALESKKAVAIAARVACRRLMIASERSGDAA